MGAAVKISDTEMMAIREAAALQSRSIAGQAEHWLRLGRAVERDPRFSYSKIEEALKGLVDVDLLTTEEQEEYFDRFEVLLSKPSAEAETFFEERRRLGLGVGMNEAGSIVEQSPTKGH